MDDELVETYISAHRRKHFLAPIVCDGKDAEMKKDIVRLLGCIQKIGEQLPPNQQQHVNRVLARELKALLSDFCFDLNAHVHRHDVDNAIRKEGLAAAINIAFDPFTDVLELFEIMGLRHA